MIANGLRARIELWAASKYVLWTIGLIITAAAYLVAVGLFEMIGATQAVWLLFAGGIGAFGCTVIYGWARMAYLNRDITTGLPRRLVAEEFLARLAQAKNDVTVAMVDINGLRETNNTAGHAEGDKLLYSVAHRLSRAGRRRGRMAARMGGGDEFIVIARNTDVHALAEEIEEVLHGKHPHFQTWGLAVAGVARARHGDRTVLECADRAMYRAKRMFYATGHSHVVVYDSTLDGMPEAKRPGERPTKRMRDRKAYDEA